jgi:hypothetical protein
MSCLAHISVWCLVPTCASSAELRAGFGFGGAGRAGPDAAGHIRRLVARLWHCAKGRLPHIKWHSVPHCMDDAAGAPSAVAPDTVQPLIPGP